MMSVMCSVTFSLSWKIFGTHREIWAVRSELFTFTWCNGQQRSLSSETLTPLRSQASRHSQRLRELHRHSHKPQPRRSSRSLLSRYPAAAAAGFLCRAHRTAALPRTRILSCGATTWETCVSQDPDSSASASPPSCRRRVPFHGSHSAIEFFLLREQALGSWFEALSTIELSPWIIFVTIIILLFTFSVCVFSGARCFKSLRLLCAQFESL